MASLLEVRMRRWSILLVPASPRGVPTPAFAQFGPGGGGGMRPGGQPGGSSPAQMGPEEKEEGPAESAPEQKAENPALQPLPAWPQQREKTLQFFQLNGYIRFRAYLFHALNLGIWRGADGARARPSPSPTPSSARTARSTNAVNPPSSCAQRDKIELPHRQPDLGRHAPAPRADDQRHRAGARQSAARRLRQPGPRLDARGLLR